MPKIIRKKILIKGVVQGVGFRPHVYKLALKRRLSGWVRNDASGVTIDVQGRSTDLQLFIKELKTRKPPAARIDSLNASVLPPVAAGGFAIIKSGRNTKAEARIPPDLALCADCRREISDPSDRRYLYPFTNCTNCGPRFTIVAGIPYDRPLTTMKRFRMCPDCLAEYRNPLDRRFHAQPNACPVCGPKVSVCLGSRRLDGHKALELAARYLAKGKIVALQGLGGFHLACDAANADAVKRLRRLKDRPTKPFAVMFSAVDAIGKFCRLSNLERAALESAAAPAVMLKKKILSALDPVAPGLDTIAVMLAYTPLHETLFRLLRAEGFTSPLVMTSGNRSDEPIAKDRAGAEENLGSMADLIVFHDREIHNRVDDSVGFIGAGAFRLVRRARGWAPDSIKLPLTAAQSAAGSFGCGADMKSAFCLTRGKEAFLSQYIGDQGEYQNQVFYAETLAKTRALLKVKPALIAYDLHPDYYSSVFARSLNGVKIPVQHHVAHILSVAAEHALEAPFIGAALDGTGYGTDGHIWGSEFFVIKGNTWRRSARLKYFALPGGDAAAREIWRPAMSLLKDALGSGWRREAGALFAGVAPAVLEAVERAADKGLNAPLTSSMGRLFDAVSFIAGLGAEATYEGQGAMELESLCSKPAAGGYSFDIAKKDGVFIIDPAKAVLGALRERGPARARARAISEKFHAGLTDALVRTVSALSSDTGIKTVALSGGVFQNRTLLTGGIAKLERLGFRVYANEKVPANDGGIALGQVYYALKGFCGVD